MVLKVAKVKKGRRGILRKIGKRLISGNTFIANREGMSRRTT